MDYHTRQRVELSHVSPATRAHDRRVLLRGLTELQLRHSVPVAIIKAPALYAESAVSDETPLNHATLVTTELPEVELTEAK